MFIIPQALTLLQENKRRNITRREDSLNAAAISELFRMSFFIFLKEAITEIGTARRYVQKLAHCYKTK